MKLHIFEDVNCKVFLVSKWSSCPLGCISHGRWRLVAVTHFCHQLLRNLGKREATVRSLLLLPVALLHLWLMLMLLLIRYLSLSLSLSIHSSVLSANICGPQCTISHLFSKVRDFFFQEKKTNLLSIDHSCFANIEPLFYN